jgi:hypothetical protein
MTDPETNIAINLKFLGRDSFWSGVLQYPLFRYGAGLLCSYIGDF